MDENSIWAQFGLTAQEKYPQSGGVRAAVVGSSVISWTWGLTRLGVIFLGPVLPTYAVIVSLCSVFPGSKASGPTLT